MLCFETVVRCFSRNRLPFLRSNSLGEAPVRLFISFYLFALIPNFYIDRFTIVTPFIPQRIFTTIDVHGLWEPHLSLSRCPSHFLVSFLVLPDLLCWAPQTCTSTITFLASLSATQRRQRPMSVLLSIETSHKVFQITAKDLEGGVSRQH